MTDRLSSDAAQRAENVLRQANFFKPVSTRRMFMSRLLAASGGAAVGGALMGRAGAAFASTDADVLNFGNAAVGAERIGIAFYSNALGTPTEFGVAADLAQGTLLNSAHRVYFNAARNPRDISSRHPAEPRPQVLQVSVQLSSRHLRQRAQHAGLR